MSRASLQYALVGFSPELDWRPLTFLKPIPPNRVCSACGLVRKTSALLPCMHGLGGCCHQQCAQGGSTACPLDGNNYDYRDVDLKEFPNDHLLSRQVKCWNEGSGCKYTTTASRIGQHFQRESEYHSVRCSKCAAVVLCRDVCAHLTSACRNTPMTPASESTFSSPGLKEEVSPLTSFQGAPERQPGDNPTHLKPIHVDIITHSDILHEVSHGINTLKELLCKQFAVLMRQTNSSLMTSQLELASSNEELKNCFTPCSDTANMCLRRIISVERALNDTFGGTRDALSRVAVSIEQVKAEVIPRSLKTAAPLTNSPSPLEITRCQFPVKDVESLRDTALYTGWAVYDSERVYLRNYCMTLEVCLQREIGYVTLSGMYTLHRGVMDDAVQWPFQGKIRMSVIHPEGGQTVWWKLTRLYVSQPVECDLFRVTGLLTL